MQVNAVNRNQRRWQIAAVLLLLVLAMLACSLPSRTATLTIINNSSQPICGVYVNEPGSATPGENRVGSEGSIASGSSFAVSEITPGTYDLRVETCDGNSADRSGEQLDGDVEWTITD